MKQTVAALAILALIGVLAACAAAPANTADERVRVFDSFTIRGAGGTHDIESAASHGANVIRTWSVGNDTQDLLDRAHELGLKVILGVWMPDPHDAEHYRIKGRYQVDYTKRQAEYADKMQSLLDRYDSHPALLMWGLGNEVEYSVTFLKTINRMSEIVHRHNPKRLTTHVSVNANQIELFAEHAPDIDVYGANSYGDGSMNNVAGILEEKWGKKYFFSEYSYHGPWSARKTATGYPLEFSPADKVKRLQQTFEVFSKHENLVGGVFFIWGTFSTGTGTWFNGMLPKNPADKDRNAPAHLTPYTDSLHAYWKGSDVANHAPIILAATINGEHSDKIVLDAGQQLLAHVDASDKDGDSLGFTYWIFETRGGSRGEMIAGPHAGSVDIALAAPDSPGAYTLLVYVTDPGAKASSHQVPFEVTEALSHPPPD